MLSLSTQCKWIYFPDLAQLKDLLHATQAKEMNYCNWHFVNQFLLLAVDIFGCFLNMSMCFYMTVPMPFGTWRGQKVFIFTLVTFFRKKTSMTLQRMQTSSILSQVIVVNLVTSQLPPLQDTPPIIAVDILKVVKFWQVNMTDLSQVVGYGHT
jgi:hypothetical protein